MNWDSQLFDTRAKAVMDSLLFISNPDQGSEYDELLGHTTSAMIGLLADLLEANTPDLYMAEWQLIADSLEPAAGYQRLPLSVQRLSSELVLSLEDMDVNDGRIASHLLGWKLAGLHELQLCAVYYHVQKYLAAEFKGISYSFPAIDYKG